jgi:hypothetical protein
MRYELAKQFSEFKLPDEVKQATRAGVQLIGSLNFTKMMMFANEVQLTNDDIDYFMNMRPQRQEDESYDDMKVRGKFSKALLKYRPHLYDYSVYKK